jgi:hypothetical protein
VTAAERAAVLRVLMPLTSLILHVRVDRSGRLSIDSPDLTRIMPGLCHEADSLMEKLKPEVKK